MMTIPQALELLIETAGTAFALLGSAMLVTWIGIIIYNVVMNLWDSRG